MWIHVSVIFVGILTIAYLIIKRQFSYWARKKVPFLKPHILYGNIGDYIRKKVSFGEVILDLYNGFKGERFGGIWEIYRPKLFIIDPNLVKDILVKDFGTWSDRGSSANSEADPLSVHLANLDGKKWKSVRVKLTPTFTSAKLKQMHYLLLECGENLERYLNAVAEINEPVEVRELTAKFTTDVIGSCVFGIQMNSMNDEDALFRKMGKKIFETSAKKQILEMIQFNCPRLFKALNLAMTPTEITKFFIKVTKDTFDYREKNNVEKHDFIDLLKNLKNTEQPLGENDVEFDDEFLAAQAFFFFAAGFETSSTTLSYCLHELAVNRDIQDRLRDEVYKTKEANDGKISWDTLKNMKYLNMIVQETLRKYPIVPQIERWSVKPYRIPDTNVVLPAGSTCFIPVYGLHHDPKYYPDPEKFHPERFTEEAKTQRPAFVYLPFGGGPRICMGVRFAEQQIKLALTKTVDTFEISLCQKSQNPLRYDRTSRFFIPEIGVWLKISKIYGEQKDFTRNQKS